MIAFPGEAQGIDAVQLDLTLTEADAVVGGEGLVTVDRHTADGVDQGLKTGEVDLRIIGHIHTVKSRQRFHRTLDAIDTAMGQLIQRTGAGIGIGNVVVTGGIQQQDLLGLGVDHHQDVHVAAAGGQLLVAGIGAAEIDHKGIFGDVGLAVLTLEDAAHGIQQAGFPGVAGGLKQSTDTTAEIPIAVQVLQQAHIGAVEDQSVFLTAEESIQQCGRTIVLGDGDITAQLLLHGSHCVIHAVTGDNGKAVTRRICKALGRIIGTDVDRLDQLSTALARGTADPAHGIHCQQRHAAGEEENQKGNENAKTRTEGADPAGQHQHTGEDGQQQQAAAQDHHILFGDHVQSQQGGHSHTFCKNLKPPDHPEHPAPC